MAAAKPEIVLAELFLVEFNAFFRFIKLTLYDHIYNYDFFRRFWSSMSRGRGRDGADFDYVGRQHRSIPDI